MGWKDYICRIRWRGSDPTPDCDEKDKAALLALMKSIGQPIPGDANTNGIF